MFTVFTLYILYSVHSIDRTKIGNISHAWSAAWGGGGGRGVCTLLENSHHVSNFCNIFSIQYQPSALGCSVCSCLYENDCFRAYIDMSAELKDDSMENSINGSRYRHILCYCGGCARRYGPGPPLLHAATPYPTPTQSCCLLHKLENPVC